MKNYFSDIVSKTLYHYIDAIYIRGAFYPKHKIKNRKIKSYKYVVIIYSFVIIMKTEK